MAGSFVVGLGAGVVILLVVWTVVLIAWVQLSAHQAGLRSLITGLSILITLVLLLIPTAKEGGLERRDAVTKNPDLLAPIDAFQVRYRQTASFQWHLIEGMFRFTTTCSSGRGF